MRGKMWIIKVTFERHEGVNLPVTVGNPEVCKKHTRSHTYTERGECKISSVKLTHCTQETTVRAQ